MLHEIYYSPFSKEVYIEYKPENNNYKIRCIKGYSNIPNSKFMEDGNIRLNDFTTCLDKGEVKITGKFCWKIPIYKDVYIKYEVVEPFSWGEPRYEYIKEMNILKIKKFFKKHNLDEEKLDVTYGEWVCNWNNYVIKKENKLIDWEDSKSFEYVNKSFKFFRKYENNINLFRPYYNITSIKIIPINNKIKTNNDTIKIVANEMSEYIDINKKINLKDEEYMEKLGEFGLLLMKHKTCRFQEIGLMGGDYVNYRIKLIDDKLDHISY